jgi:mannitol-1-phosphate/altronate dehydrogenase
MESDRHVFVGFGFGPIQAGLFAREAYASGRFERVVVAEINQELVAAVRANGNRYMVNVAHADHVETLAVKDVELLDPGDRDDLERLGDALGSATEIATSLPSVKSYASGGATSAAALIARGLAVDSLPGTIIYTAENNNHAAEILERNVAEFRKAGRTRPCQFLNTVIGKMSQVIHDPEIIRSAALSPVAPGLHQAFLVEAFNHILVARQSLPGFAPGIDVFAQKADLLPFEEAKLYGHNAIHSLLAYLGSRKGYTGMSELRDDADLMDVARVALVDESGRALIGKHAELADPLFTLAGFSAYAEDLLERMTNPYLADSVGRAARDPARKLALHDRIFGAMSLALAQDVSPNKLALGAAAGLLYLLEHATECGLPPELLPPEGRRLAFRYVSPILEWCWTGQESPHKAALIDCVIAALREKVLGPVIE